MDYAGKKVLITGGTSGIGLAVAQQLVAKGAKVVTISRNPDKAKGVLPENVECEAADVRDRDALASVFEKHAQFHALVCAATGGERSMGPFLQMDLDGYQASFDKLWGYANCVRLAADHMTNDAAFVLVSGAPARRAKPGQVSLASVGGAVEAFCRTVAPEIYPRRINVVSPGLINTPMFGPKESERMEVLGAATKSHIIPRPGDPNEVANGILFVLENDFVTGTTVDVDGGWLLS